MSFCFGECKNIDMIYKRGHEQVSFSFLSLDLSCTTHTRLLQLSTNAPQLTAGLCLEYLSLFTERLLGFERE